MTDKTSRLAAVKDRLNRKFRGEWMDAIYPGLSFDEQSRAFGRDLIALGEACLGGEAALAAIDALKLAEAP